jgi:hypothetical protein
MERMSEAKMPANYYGESPDPLKLPDADPNDVKTVENIIRASYECISGPPGKEPDWKRQHTLFLPDARSIRTGPIGEGRLAYRMMSTEDYIAQMHDWLTENGFYETEIHRVVEQFGNIAHVFSTYESRRDPADKEPFMRGINSFQLFHDGTRWWIMNIMWRHESPDLPLPDRYLPGR